MFCKKCGAQLSDDAVFCSKCGASLTSEATPSVAEAEKAEPATEETKFFKAPSKGGKSYAAIFSAFTLIPAIFTLMIDYVWNLRIDWPATGYIVGLLLVIWVCAVLPALRITPAPVTAIICFASAALYVMYIVKQISGSMEWFTVFALPMLMILAVFIGLDSALTSNKIATALMPGIVAGEAAIYSFTFGLLWSNYYDDAVYMPRISVVFACGFLMLSVVLFAAGYVKMINKKN